MKLLPYCSVLFFGLLGSSGAQPARSYAAMWPPVAIPSDLVAEHDVVMGKGGDQVLHAEIIRLKAPEKDRRRAIIYVHGGGWSGGTNAYDVSRVFFLARAGYLLVSIDYRLSIDAKWPAQIEDCKLGVRWLRANAAHYGIDPDRIGVYGHSAGGHLVACLGVMDDPRFEGVGGYPGISSCVQAVVDVAGPVDLTGENFYACSPFIPEEQKPKDREMMETLLGAPATTAPALFREASPILQIKPTAPPFLIAHGEKDAIVSPVQSLNFAAALRRAGVSAEHVMVKNGAHGLGPIPGDAPPAPDSDALHRRILDFYAQHLGN